MENYFITLYEYFNEKYKVIPINALKFKYYINSEQVKKSHHTHLKLRAQNAPKVPTFKMYEPTFEFPRNMDYKTWGELSTFEDFEIVKRETIIF